MPRSRVLINGCIIVAILLLLSGCSAPAPLQEAGSVQVTSLPDGAGVYLDHEYRGTTPVTVSAVPAGSHTVEVRLDGYKPWSSPVTIAPRSAATLAATLVRLPATLPVTFAPTTGPTARPDLPQIHVDGYWTYLPGRESAANPVPLLVHTDAFNVGYADAHEVTVSADFLYEGRQVCWNTVYLGTLKAGGHVTKDSMVSCTLPSGFSASGLTVRFGNLVVTQ